MNDVTDSMQDEFLKFILRIFLPIFLKSPLFFWKKCNIIVT